MSLWSGLKSIIAPVAPILGTVIGGPAGTIAGAMIAKKLGVEATPEAVQQALQADPNAASKLAQIEAENRGDLDKLYAEAVLAEVHEQNQTMRAEIASQDKFVRRWRPFFGYVTAICFLAQFLMVLIVGTYTVIWDPDHITQTFNGLFQICSALTSTWAIALSVLGVSIAQRSRDKQIAAGHPPEPSLIGAITQRLIGGTQRG
ncbi:3TM-type holin [Kordiimonas marina]|uniref:3TM-type holin n=1 Tax=Kordiimonas marina TaxID=2872312 RepID=UPI001FF434A7|nr:3TM-type holin [Kordiimonas marina]MCJ9428561.1 holin family protein [Kordiimonas marina]